MSLWSRFTGLFSRRLNAELDAELRSHIEMRTEMNIASGMSADDARRDALRRFGNATWMKEETRGADVLPWLESLFQDLRYAGRMFRKAPGFTAAAVLTLTLGIGANTAVFSLLRAVLLRGLPFPHAEQLVRIDEVDASGEFGRSGIALKGVSPPDMASFRDQNRTFENLGGYTEGSAILSGNGEPRRIDAHKTTYNLFATMGVHPMIGRDFLPEDEVAGGSHVAIVSYSLAQTLGSPEKLLGTAMTLNAENYTIIGIMPRGFVFPLDTDPLAAWTPLSLQRDPNLRAANYVTVVGRLKPGVTAAQATTDLDHIAKQQPVGGKTGELRWGPNLTGLKENYTGSARSPLVLLAAAVGFVLLIAAANVASLCLSRSAARQRELAVRLALGASRRRLLRQLLTESVMLALMGGIAGAILALWARQTIVSIAPASLPLIAPIEIDWTVALFTIVLSLVTGIAAGVVPAIRFSQCELNRAMKDGTTVSPPGNQTLHGILVVGEFALAAILLFGAGLMVRTLGKLYSVDRGFDSHNVLTAEVLLPKALYRSGQQQSTFVDQVLQRLQAVHGVDTASATSSLPMSGTRMVFHLTITNPGQPPISVVGSLASVTPDYFRALRIPLVYGRYFTDLDQQGTLPVGIVNESLARQRWPGEDPIGKQMVSGFTPKPVIVVGVVRDVRQTSLDTTPRPELYVPFTQVPWPFARFAIRTRAADPTTVAPALRAVVRAVDHSQTVDKVQPFDVVVERSVAERRFYMLQLTVFAVVALVLASVGIFGVVAFAVAQRTREIGVRMALGATHSQVLALVMRRACRLVLIGLVSGIAVSLLLVRLLGSLLFGVRPSDPLTFGVASAVLLSVALFASYLPARRAMRVDPTVALRYE